MPTASPVPASRSRVKDYALVLAALIAVVVGAAMIFGVVPAPR